MTTYVLIHGAASDSWYWHRVAPELRALGHEVVAPDLPCEDDSAGLAEYTQAVVDAIGDRTGLIVVAQSLGGFTAPLVCDRVGADGLVMLAAMIPAPGERGADWWANTGHEQAVRERAERDGRDAGQFDPVEMFLHDLPPDVYAEALRRGEKDQSGTPLLDPWPLKSWPDVPTKVLICREDRFFPPEFQRRVSQDRLGIVPDEMEGGHLPALGHPKELVERLEGYRADVEPGSRA